MSRNLFIFANIFAAAALFSYVQYGEDGSGSNAFLAGRAEQLLGVAGALAFASVVAYLAERYGRSREISKERELTRRRMRSRRDSTQQSSRRR